METDKGQLSPGAYLKSIRLENGISLEAVSGATKIGIDHLLHIEMDYHEKLPAEVFVKGFLRAYAKAIGLDDDEVIRRYLFHIQNFQGATGVRLKMMKPRQRIWLWVLMAFGVLICSAAWSVFGTSILNPESEKVGKENRSIGRDGTTEQANVVLSTVQTDGLIKDMLTIHLTAHIEMAPKKAFSQAITKPLLLRIVTVQETWIKVTVDEQNTKRYSLNPGDRMEFEASPGFQLIIGNAEGVQLTLNNKPVSIIGKAGQVVNIQYPYPGQTGDSFFNGHINAD